MGNGRPKVVIIFVVLFALVGVYWALLASAGVWLIISDDEQFASGDEIAIAITMIIVISAVISHFLSSVILFIGKRPKKTIIGLVIVNIITNVVFVLAIPSMLPFFVPIIIFNLVFLIVLRKSEVLEKYTTEIYSHSKPQPSSKPQSVRCTKCDNVADSSQKFCKKCGSSFSGGTQMW